MNTKEDALNNAVTKQLMVSVHFYRIILMDILPNIVFCVQQKRETHTGSSE